MASADDREELLAQVKRDVRSLLISAKSGLAIQDLYRDYQSLVFSPLPFRKLGFQTARAFLQSVPDVCQCQLLPGGDCLVTAVADSSTAHIQKMVQRQKPSQKRGATARVLSSRYVRRSTPARSASSRDQPAQTWHRPAAASQRKPQPAPQPKPKPKPEPEPQVEVPPRGAAQQRASTRPASPQPVPARLAGRLAQVLLARQDGLPIERLSALYDAAAPGEAPLDWTALGYHSCAELLLQLPHIARVVNSWSGLRAYPARALLAADRESDGGGRRSRQSGGTDGGDQASRSTAAAAGVQPTHQREAAEPERRPSPVGASGPTVAGGSSSSGRRQGLMASISETVQTIVEKHPNGLLCSKLPAEYQLKTGYELALAELGHYSVLELVARLPLRAIKSNAFGDWLLFTLRQPLPDFVNDETQADDGLMAEAGDGSRLQEAKERIRDILFSFPDGLRMSGLEDHYQMNCNERLPYAALGFTSVEKFVLHLTKDVLTVKFVTDELKLFPIVPAQSEQVVSCDLYPADAVGPGRSFERVKFPDVPCGEYNLEIFVAEVYHPHKFWFHLVGDQYAEALESLMDDMEMTYCTTINFKYRMQEATVRVGQVCACPYGEQGYHRAVITGVRPAPEPVKVFYVDYGSVGTISRDLLRFLPEKYFNLPAQALLGRLANIEPPDVEGWSHEASKTFLSLVDNSRVLYAMVLERSPSCVSLCLCDTNGATDLHINDRLVELDYAVFHNQSVDIDEKAVEELSRPVSVAPSPRSVTEPGPRLSLTPEPAPTAGRSTPSDIDRLLQETLSSPAAAASPPPAPAPGPSQPPGFSGLPPAVAPVASSTACTQMLTQSALLNNLQMMQLNLMNPMMMNPAYAALLLSQAAGGVAAAPPAAPQQTTGKSAAAGPAAASEAPPVTASSAPGAASSQSATVTTAPSLPAPLLTSSVVSGGQDAGVCITAPIQADGMSSCQELTEEEIAQMNQELGELAIQRRFIKRISVPVGVVHLICLRGAGYLVSAEISHFLWTRDILHTMLLMKQITLPHRSVDVESHQDLFAELVRYNVPGVMDGEELVDPLTLYPITCVPRVFAVFKNMKNKHDVKGIIEDIIAEFDPAEPYWASSDEEDELAELSSETVGGSPASPSLPPPSAVAAAVLPERDGEGRGLLPEMRSILAQLQSKRRRKVEATMMGLQGTDFSPEDVIGDELRRMDAQISSFQHRIDDLVSGRPAVLAGFQPGPDCAITTGRAASISMNPDAPEFIHSGQESVLAGSDSTLAAGPRRRAPVELRAPDGTPIDLNQWAKGTQTRQRRASGTSAAPPPALTTLPARKPVELRTPDGRTVQLGRPAAAAPTAHGPPPPPLSAVGAAPAPAPAPPVPQPASRHPAPPPPAAAEYQSTQYQQLSRYGHPAMQPLRPPQQQQQQQQWPRLQPPQLGPPLVTAGYHQPYVAYQQMYQPGVGPFPRLQQPVGFLPQQMFAVQPGYQPGPASYPAPPSQQAPPAAQHPQSPFGRPAN